MNDGCFSMEKWVNASFSIKSYERLLDENLPYVNGNGSFSKKTYVKWKLSMRTYGNGSFSMISYVNRSSRWKPTWMASSRWKPTWMASSRWKPTWMEASRWKPTWMEASPWKPTWMEASRWKPTWIEALDEKPTWMEASRWKTNVNGSFSMKYQREWKLLDEKPTWTVATRWTTKVAASRLQCAWMEASRLKLTRIAASRPKLEWSEWQLLDEKPTYVNGSFSMTRMAGCGDPSTSASSTARFRSASSDSNRFSRNPPKCLNENKKLFLKYHCFGSRFTIFLVLINPGDVL